MTIRTRTILLTFLMALSITALSNAQELEQFEEQFEKKKQERKPDRQEVDPGPPHDLEGELKEGRTIPYKEKEDEGLCDLHCESAAGCFLEVLFCPILEGFLGAPFRAINQGDLLPISRYPYQFPEGGYLLPRGSEEGRMFGFNTSAAYQRLSRRTEGWMTEIQFKSQYRYGIELDFIHFNEGLERGEDNLDYLSVLFQLVPLETTGFSLDYAVGGIGLFGREDRGGPSFALGLVIFPRKPVVLRARAAMGFINWRALGDLSAEIGGNMGPAEIFGGYRSLIGPDHDLSGPFLGMRIWF